MATGFRRRPALVEPAPVEEERPALVAAAAPVPLDGASASALHIRDLEWQNEAWRHYDICGEFRFAANRHGSAVSRCRIYLCELDQFGRPGQEVDPSKDPKLAAIPEGLFGGPAAKAQALRTIGISEYVAGECFTVAVAGANGQPDKWWVTSSKNLRRSAGQISAKIPMRLGGGMKVLVKGQDLLTRLWTEHPRLFDVADSPARAVLPTLREIERLTQLVFSQIDSRLASAGLLLFREGVDFPRADKEKPGGLLGLQELIMDAARANLQGAGSAAGIIPIMATIPGGGDQRGDNIQNAVAHIKFDTPIQEGLDKKLDQAIRRLALGLDIAPEDLLGQGDANHWGSWQIEESSIKLFIEPVLTRLCDAFYSTYGSGAVKLLGKDPDRYTFWYDTAPLTVRPNRFEDALQLWDRLVISDEALRAAGNFDEDDAPDQDAKNKALTDERLRQLVWLAVKMNPALLSAPGIARVLGFPEKVIEMGLAAVPAAPPAPPEDQMGMDQGGPPQLPPGQDAGAAGDIPAMPDQQTTPAQQGGRNGFAAMLPAAEQIVLRALEVAGKRQLTREMRGRYGDTAHFELHVQLPVADRARADELLAGAWSTVPNLAAHYHVPPAELERLLREYCVELLAHGYAHDPALLREVMVRARIPEAVR